MLWIFQAFALCAFAQTSFAQTGCPANAQQRLMECSQLLSGFGKAQSPAEMEQFCANAPRGIACIKDVVKSCQGVEGTSLGEMINSLNQPGFEAQLNSICSGPGLSGNVRPGAVIDNNVPTQQSLSENVPLSNEVSRCSRRDERKLQKCFRRMQRYAAESPIRCGKMRKAIDCMTSLIAQCSSKVEPGTISVVNALRSNVMEICVETNLPIEDENEDTNASIVVPDEDECPADYADKIMECLAPMDVMDSSNLGEMCRVSIKGMGCVDDIISKCEGRPGVDDIVKMVDMEQMRKLLGTHCTGTVGNVDKNCPTGHTDKLMACLEPMNAVQRGGIRNIKKVCRIFNTGMDCVQDILDKCPNQPDISAMTKMMNLDQIRGLVNSQCKGEPMPNLGSGSSNANCPSDYSANLMNCVEPMQRFGTANSQNMAEACGVAQAGFTCLDEIISNCGGEPEVQAITSMLNIEEMRTMINSACSSMSSSNCGIANPGAELQRCNSFLDSVRDEPNVSDPHCRILEEGFGCFRNLISRCPTDPAVVAFTSVIDIEEARDALTIYCPSRK